MFLKKGELNQIACYAFVYFKKKEKARGGREDKKVCNVFMQVQNKDRIEICECVCVCVCVLLIDQFRAQAFRSKFYCNAVKPL